MCKSVLLLLLLNPWDILFVFRSIATVVKKMAPTATAVKAG
jgi:hypothetical protein